MTRHYAEMIECAGCNGTGFDCSLSMFPPPICPACVGYRFTFIVLPERSAVLTPDATIRLCNLVEAVSRYHQLPAFIVDALAAITADDREILRGDDRGSDEEEDE